MHNTPIGSEELARYSRQIILPGFSTEGQQRLKNARVLIVGAGGLGSPTAIYLATAGIGTLGIADFDKVEIHNLHRQILHNTKSVGRSKLESAKAHLNALNPHVSIKTHPSGLNTDNALEIMADYDLVIDGSDNFPTRFMVADASYLARTPLVSGAIFQFEGQISTFDPNSNGPCYRCLFPQMPGPGSIPNCAEAGVIGAICGIIGSFQALEAIKHLTKIGSTLNGQLLHIDTGMLRFNMLQIKADPDCPLCGEHPSITELNKEAYEWQCESDSTDTTDNEQSLPEEVNVEESKIMLEQANPPKLLDVREPYELDICKIKGALNIPLDQIANNLDGLKGNDTYLVYCHHGMRSLKATQQLREHGIKASSMIGGIHSWAEAYEPSMQRY